MNLQRRLKASLFALIGMGGVTLYFYNDSAIGLILFVVTLPSYYVYCTKPDEQFQNLSQSDLLPQFKDIEVIRIENEHGLKTEISGVRLKGALTNMKGLKRTNSTIVPDHTFAVSMVDRWGGEFPMKLIQSGNEFQLVVQRVHLRSKRLKVFGKEITTKSQPRRVTE
ncbi:MAG: hypothetical protein ACSHYA_05285 [Opitutaceae bacterium]